MFPRVEALRVKKRDEKAQRRVVGVVGQVRVRVLGLLARVVAPLFSLPGPPVAPLAKAANVPLREPVVEGLLLPLYPLVLAPLVFSVPPPGQKPVGGSRLAPALEAPLPSAWLPPPLLGPVPVRVDLSPFFDQP